MNNGKVFLGIVASAAAGAALGVLFAPDKGTETRNKISQKSREYRDNVVDKFNGAVNTITDKFRTARNGVEELVEATTSQSQEKAASAARKARS